MPCFYFKFCSGKADTHLFNNKAKETIFEPKELSLRKTLKLTNTADTIVMLLKLLKLTDVCSTATKRKR